MLKKIKGIQVHTALAYFVLLPTLFFVTMQESTKEYKICWDFIDMDTIGRHWNDRQQEIDRLTPVIQKTHKHTDPKYLVELIPIVVDWSWNRNIDVLWVSAIISVETNWIRQERYGMGGGGPMQVNHTCHAERFGVKDISEWWKNLNLNLEAGTWVLQQCHGSAACYNGHPDLELRAEYVTNVNKRFKRISRAWKENP